MPEEPIDITEEMRAAEVAVPPAGPEPHIRFEHVYKDCPPHDAVLENVSVSIMPGEFISIVGPSGAGKSTFLKLMYAEEVPTSGAVYFNGRNINDIPRKHLPFYRRNIGTVFQDFKQPGLRIGALLVRTNKAISLQKSFLYKVICIIFIRSQMERKVVQCVHMR